MHRKRPQELRSHRWLGVNDLRAFGHRSRLKQFGYDGEDWGGRPVIDIINTWSEINSCHAHLRARAENVKRGVLQGGGFPIELPAISLAEPFVKPSTMLYRNFLAMETETSAQSSHRRRRAARRLRQDNSRADHGRHQHGHSRHLCAGRADVARQLARPASRLRLRCLEILDGETGRQHQRSAMDRDGGRHRALVRNLHGDGNGGDHDGDRRGARSDAAGRFVHSRGRLRSSAHVRGCRAANCRNGLGGSALEQILTRLAFDNAIKVHMALGGSTNAIIHVIAMARRAGIPLDMQRFDEISRDVPVLANVRPSGKYLMEDFYLRRRGLRALMVELKDKLDLTCRTVTGRIWGGEYSGRGNLPARCHPSRFRSDLCARRHRGAYRQSRAARLCDEARGGRPAVPAASGTGIGLRGQDFQLYDAADEAAYIAVDETARVSPRHPHRSSNPPSMKSSTMRPPARSKTCRHSKTTCRWTTCPPPLSTRISCSMTT